MVGLETSSLAGSSVHPYTLHRQPFDWSLRETDSFFVGKGPVHRTLERLIDRLREEGIPHAVAGGMAMAAHGFVRMTEDVDLLVTEEGLEAFRDRCVGRGYVAAFPGARKSFRDAETGVRIEFLTAGEFPGDGRPKAVRFPDPEDASVEVREIQALALERLIELKLASGISAPHRLRDLADVQDLIRALRLPEELAEELDDSVRGKYRELWRAVQEGGEDEKLCA